MTLVNRHKWEDIFKKPLAPRDLIVKKQEWLRTKNTKPLSITQIANTEAPKNIKRILIAEY